MSGTRSTGRAAAFVSPIANGWLIQATVDEKEQPAYVVCRYEVACEDVDVLGVFSSPQTAFQAMEGYIAENEDDG